ncbi:terminase small subunit [Anaeroselena agilis]|uniref:Terminase small subunit n=1 Tax=Anaeroselena agilis TaxID=3063788 RepID=A0ABU3NWH0_9FIRM|nr:terminase small subunit [Selenomonadales bacterium 4137-cl]
MVASTHTLAERDYILGMSYQAIAEKHNVTINTVKSWKVRYKWERDKPVKGQKKTAHSAHKVKSVHTSEKGAQPPEEELSEQEQLFCYHYVRTWNATQAYLKAGYSCNKAAAKVSACRMLQRPFVRAEVDRLRELFRMDIHVDIQDFLAFCMKVVGADVGDMLTFGQKEVPVIGMYGPIELKDEDTGAKTTLMQTINFVDLADSEQLDTSIIQEVKQGKDGISVKLADKKWAWEQLAKYFDWLPDKWQRSVEDRRLALEERKVAAMEKGTGVGNGPAGVQIVDDIPRR